MKYCKSNFPIHRIIHFLHEALHAQTFIDIEAGIPGASSSSVAWGDYDNDGDLDMLISGYSSSGRICSIYKNDGNDLFTEQTAISLPGIDGGSANWGDYDNDNDLDILISGRGNQNDITVIYQNNGNNTFTEKDEIGLSGNKISKWGDYDSDGDLDIIIMGEAADGSFVKIFRNNGDQTFTDQSSIVLPNLSSAYVSFGDYNNDSYLDFIVLGLDPEFILQTKIYKNNGDNSFSEQSDITLKGIYYGHATWGDYDNNGYLDILLSGNNKSIIYRNNGDNSFSEQASIQLPGLSNGFGSWGDINLDGYLDILVSGETSSSTISSIFINDQNNSFIEQTEVSLSGIRYGSNALGDYNSDGKLDIILSGLDESSNFVSGIYKNTSDLVNAIPDSPAGLTSILTDTSVQLNWDVLLGDETPSKGISYNVRVGSISGSNDIVSSMSLSSGKRLIPGMGNAQTDTTFILRNLNKGTYYWSVQAIDAGFSASTFSSEQTFVFNSSLQASDVFIDSLDSEGLKLHWCRGNGSSCAVFAYKGNSGSAEPVDNTSYSADNSFGIGSQIGTSGWYCVYNGTGTSVNISGLVSMTNYRFQVIEYDPGPIYFQEIGHDNPIDTTTALFSEQSEIDITAIYQGSVAWGDYDNDDDLDILISGNSSKYNESNITRIYRNDGSNSFVYQSGIILSGVNKGTVAWNDYDNDDYIDIVLTGSAKTEIYHNNGNNTFTLQENLPLLGLTESSAAWDDFDNDGDSDLLLVGATSSGESAFIYRNNGDGTFSEQPGLSIEGKSGGNSNWGDYNNDGYSDILITGSGAATVYLNNGDKTFDKQSEIILTGSFFGASAWGDFDSDGDLDIILTGNETSSGGNAGRFSKIYRNDGNNSFSELTTINIREADYSSVCCGDYDNDGDLDFLLSGRSIKSIFSTIYENTDNLTFKERSTFNLENVMSGSCAFADYDNDNDLDILLSGHDGSNLITKIYRNDISIPNTKPSPPTGLKNEKHTGSTIFSWISDPADETSKEALTYNLKIGTSSGGCEIMAPNSSPQGFVKIPKMGNCQLDTFHIIHELYPGTYYWSVQTVDNSFSGSEYSIESNFIIDSIQAKNLQAKLFPENDNSLILKWEIGNGQRRIIFCKNASTGKASPINNTTYLADPIFGYGDQIDNSGWYCVYNGRGDSTIVTGLTPGLAYTFHVIEYIGKTGEELYYTGNSEANPGIFATGLFSEQANIVFPGADYSTTEWGDFDNDGFLDILFTGHNSSMSYISKLYHNNGNNTFSEKADAGLYNAMRGSTVWGDYDLDNDLDILLSGSNPLEDGTVSKVYSNNSGGTIFTEEPGISLTGVSDAATSWIDFNNDGFLDIILTGYNNGDYFSKIYRNTESGSFEEVTTINLSGVTNSSVACGDYDNDGDQDFVLIGFSGNDVVSQLFTNNGNFSFSEQESVDLPDLYESSSDWGDYDNDGDLDLLLTGYLWISGVYYTSGIYKNNGDYTFTEQSSISLTGVAYGSSKWGDYDNDGYLDILLTGKSDTGPISKIYRNNRDNTFTEQTSLNLTGVENSSVDWGDYDNDGDLDIFMNGNSVGSGEISKIYRNNIIMNAGDFIVNRQANAPKNLSATPEPNAVRLSWSPVIDDETPSESMSYNVHIGTTKDNSEICPSHSSMETGYRQIAEIGNAQLDTSYFIRDLDAGKYYWTVQAVDQSYKGGEWSITDSFEVRALQAFFSFDTVCSGYVTSFTDQSVATDGIDSWLWDFGDGNTSNTQSPAYTFSTSGTHQVKLIIQSGTSKDSLSKEVWVLAKPTVSFIADNVCQGSSTVFNNTTLLNGTTISSWNWDFGNGINTSTKESPDPVFYSSTGEYTVKLIATATNGCADSIENSAILSEYPSAIIATGVNPEFCEGDSIRLSVPENSNYSYQWKIGGINKTDADSSVYYAKSSGAYDVSVTNNIGLCTSNSPESANIIVTPAPSQPYIQTDGLLTFCSGDSVILSVTNDSEINYQWKLNGGDVGSDSNVFSAKSLGTYTVELENSSGCTSISSNSIEVTVKTSPAVPSVTPNGPKTFCSGGAVELSTDYNPTLTYQWLNGEAVITDSISSSFTAKTSGSYKLKVTNAATCTSESQISEVIVNPTPMAPNMNNLGDDIFCQGDSTILSITDDPELIYQWKVDGIIIGGDSSRIKVGGAGTYTIVATNTYECSASASNPISLTVNSKPAVPSVTPNGPKTFCSGGAVELSSDNNTALTYQWLNGEAIITAANSSSFTAESSGSYKLKVTNDALCSSESQISEVIVNPTPMAPNMNNLGDYIFCQGDSTILSITDDPELTYQWKVDGIIIGGDSSRIKVGGAGTYTIVATNTYECSASASNPISLTVNSKPAIPAINAVGPKTFCEGNSVALSTSNITSLNYLWLNGEAAIANATTSSYTAETSGSYKLKVTNANDCSSESQITEVIVKPNPAAPTIQRSGDLEFCSDDAVTLSFSQVSGNTYEWLFDDTKTGKTTSTISANESGSYKVSVENTLSKCTSLSTNTIDVLVHDLPPIPAIALTGELNSCDDEHPILNIIEPGNYNYQWMKDASPLNGQTGTSLNISQSGSYYLKVSNSDASQCSVNTSTYDVNVYAYPDPPIIETENYTLDGCQEDVPIVLSIETVENDIDYQWLKNNKNIANATGSVYEGYLSEGEYKVIADNNGCSSESDSIVIRYAEMPDKPSIIAEGPTVWYLACSDTAATDYRWYLDGQIIAGANERIYVANQEFGKYEVSISEGACYTKSDPVWIPLGTGIDLDPWAGLKIYPNPTPGLFTLEMDNAIMGELIIDIINERGAQILNIKFRKETNRFQTQIDLSGQPAAVYLINLMLEEYKASRRLIVE